MVLFTRLQASAGSFGILLVPGQMAGCGPLWELAHYLHQRLRIGAYSTHAAHQPKQQHAMPLTIPDSRSRMERKKNQEA
jgi:hypothetical protein